MSEASASGSLKKPWVKTGWRAWKAYAAPDLVPPSSSSSPKQEESLWSTPCLSFGTAGNATIDFGQRRRSDPFIKEVWLNLQSPEVGRSKAVWTEGSEKRPSATPGKRKPPIAEKGHLKESLQGVTQNKLGSRTETGLCSAKRGGLPVFTLDIVSPREYRWKTAEACQPQAEANAQGIAGAPVGDAKGFGHYPPVSKREDLAETNANFSHTHIRQLTGRAFGQTVPR